MHDKGRPATHGKRRKAPVFSWLMMLVGIAAIAFAMANLVPMWKEDAESQQVYMDIRARGSWQPQESADFSVVPERRSEMNFSALSEINSDVVAWLHAPDTPIDYPVVQGRDNEKYLQVGFDGVSRKAGCLFLDARADALFEDLHNPIYGHNMKDHSMFGDLAKYRDKEFALEHMKIQLYTPQGDWVLVPFSVYSAPDYGNYHTPFSSAKDGLERAQGWIRKSVVDFGTAIHLGDRVVTLISCFVGDSNQRLVLHTVMTRPEAFNER